MVRAEDISNGTTEGDPRTSGPVSEYMETEEHVIYSIIRHQIDEGQNTFNVKCYGYHIGDCTWEPVTHLPRGHIVRYARKKNLDLTQQHCDALTFAASPNTKRTRWLYIS